MADVNTARVDVLVRQNLIPELPRLFQEKTPLLELIGEGKADLITQAGIEFLMNVLPAGPSTYTPEAGLWPTPLPLTDIKGRVRYTRLQRTIGFTGDEWIHFNKLSDKEIVENLSGRTARDMSSAKKQQNQHSYGIGNGEVARVGTGGSLPSTVTSPVYMAKTTAEGSTFGAFKIIEGASYQFYTSAGVQRTDGGVTVSKAVTVTLGTANTVVFDTLPNTSGTPTLTATDIIVAVGDYNYAPYGLDYFFKTTGITQNLSTDTFRNIRPTIIQAAGNYISAPLLSRLKHDMDYRVDDDAMANLITLSAGSQHYGYELNGHPLRRAAMNDRTYDGSFTSVEFEGGKWFKDPDAPRDTVYRWTKGDIERAELYAYSVFELQGNTVHLRWGGSGGVGQHVFAVNMYFLWIGQNFCRRPNRLSALRGLSLDGLPMGFN